MRRATAAFAKWLVLLLITGLLVGCATTPLERARAEFYAGRFQQSEAKLTPIPDEDKDEVLFLMERGMVRQVLGRYEESSADWRAAAELNDLLETYSISRGTASLVTSDRVLSFRGHPFERTLLYTFLANNYLAQHNWDYAAICARNIIQHLENREGFPDIGYSRYMAGFCLELIGDMGNASLQYRVASELTPGLFIEENSGRITEELDDVSETTAVAEDEAAPYELVCFIAMGAAGFSSAYPSSAGGSVSDGAPYAEFYHDGEYIGRSYMLNRVSGLRRKTEQQLALLQVAKGISRIAIKEAISRSIERQNELAGFLTRLTLFALEAPDTRRWETLPEWLGVARLASRTPVESYEVVFRNSAGLVLQRKTIDTPISRRGNIFISFCRDIQEVRPDAS